MKRSLQPQNEPNEIERPDIKRKKTGQNAFVSVSPPIVGIFRLNVDVFRNIFDYCSIPDLYALATSSDQLKAVVLETGTISGRMFNFEEIAECCHILDVFKVFGQQMTRIKFSEKDVQYNERTESKLDGILQLISTYCAIDTLKHLDLQYFYGTSIKKRRMYSALPFFQSIESFSVEEIDSNGTHICADYFEINPNYNTAINELVERIIGSAKNLTAIELIRLKVTGRFFFADHVRENLKNLSIVQCNIKVPDAFISYLEAAPKLVSFKWDASSLLGKDTPTTHSSNIVYELVAEHVADLEAFEYDQNEFYMTDRNRGGYVPSFTWPNEQLIRKFHKLKVLGLKGVKIECLQLLAQMNQIEELKANLSLAPEENLEFLTTFTNLKSVKFHTHEWGKETHMNYLQRLPQLIKCHITVSYNFPAFGDVLGKAVEAAKDLSILKIDGGPGAGYLEIGIYQKLLTARLAHGAGSPMTLQLSQSEKKWFISRLGQTYRPDIIKIQ